jgi:HAD superfamily hydrolase (TIGR01662 family)
MLIPRNQIHHRDFAQKYTAVAFDVDGTLRHSLHPVWPFPTRRGEWEFCPNVQAVIQEYYTPMPGLRYAFVTNQAGIAMGVVAYADACTMLEDLVPLFCRQSVDIFLCPHAVDAGCACRKPSPYFLLRFAFIYHVPMPQLLYVGDMLTDFEAADRAGCDFCWSPDFFGW